MESYTADLDTGGRRRSRRPSTNGPTHAIIPSDPFDIEALMERQT
jgi:hypothetical protein